MKTKLSLRAVLSPAAALFVICAVVTALLAGTNLLTRDVIAAQALAAEEASRRVVLPEAESFAERTLTADGAEISYYEGLDASGAPVGAVFVTGAKGYGGEVSVMTGLDNGGAVRGVVILSHEETPGLGANAENESFLGQYSGGTGPFSVVKSAPAGENQVEALTGATVTSTAVTEAVNQAVSYFEQGKEGA